MRKKLILMISASILATAFLIGLLALASAYDEIEEVYDAQLAHAAKVLLQITEHEVGEHNAYEIKLRTERNNLSHRYENEMTFRIWKEAQLVAQSVLAVNFTGFRAPEGYSNQKLKNAEWRFFVLLDRKTGITIEVAEKREVRQELILKILGSFMGPLALFFPLVIVMVWWVVTRSFKPLIRMSEQVDLRETNDFSPIDAPVLTKEIQPLIRAFNSLLRRMEQSFAREQSFTDNAAHELRTPLAAMKTQTQVLLKKLKAPDHQEDLNNLHASIDRTTHMVEQLLAFSRMQSEQNMETEYVDLSELIKRAIAEAAPLIKKKNLSFRSKIPDLLTLHGHPLALELMVRNLLDNTVKYTPEGGAVSLNLYTHDNEIILELSDTGPGIPDAEKEKVFERFYRGKKNEETGSGLGLAMVRWACDYHNATVNIQDNRPNGLIVKVTIKQ